MNYRNSIFKFMGIAAMALAVTSCTVDEAQDVALVKLGALEKEFVVEAEASTFDINLYANSAYRLERINDTEDWLSFTYGDIVEEEVLDAEGNPTGEKTGAMVSKITVETGFNEGFKRKAGLVLCSEVDGRRDTLYVKQKALIEAKLQFEGASITFPGAGGEQVSPIVSNIPFEDVIVEITYGDENNVGWIEDLTIPDAETEERQMVLTLAANPSDEAPRAANVVMLFTDGWGDEQRVEFNLLQRTSKETFGEPITMEQFCQNYTTGKPINEYILLEGIVTSNKAGMNAGEPDQQTTSVIDYEPIETTVYLQTPDGSRGIAVFMETPEDNIFEQWDHVQLLIHGTTGVLKENPERYELKGVNKTMITVREAGSKSDITVKNKTISQLTDNDIYTYVNLQDVYFPVRKGSLFPVNGGYAIETGAHRNAKYPRLLVDKDGNDLYLMTNSKCLYRSNGRCLPYGSGYVSGVVVHERYSRFNWRDGADPAEVEDDPTLGYIGRYCLRHQTEGDVFDNLAASVEDCDAALLCEYRWWYPDTENEVMKPTYGSNGWFTHTHQPKYTGDEDIAYRSGTYKQHVYGAGNYCYLGPVGNNAANHYGANYGNMNGCGMIIDPAKEHFLEDASLGPIVSRNPDGTIEWAGPCASNKYAAEGNSTATGHPDKAAFLAGQWGKGFTTGASLPTASNAVNYSGSTSMRGKANASGSTYNTFCQNYWWNYEKNEVYAWLLMADMSKVSAAQNPVLQISAVNVGNTYGPRFWALEWSTSDDQKGTWNRIADYNLSDVSAWANTLFASNTAYEGINFKLPAEVCGLSEVYFRLIPTSDLCSSGADYADDILENGTSATGTQGASAIEYIAIRYTK